MLFTDIIILYFKILNTISQIEPSDPIQFMIIVVQCWQKKSMLNFEIFVGTQSCKSKIFVILPSEISTEIFQLWFTTFWNIQFLELHAYYMKWLNENM